MQPSASICTTCGTQYPPSDDPPARCPICEDDRQYINPKGQQWTTLAEMQGIHTNRFVSLAPALTGIVTEAQFAIGEQAHLIQTAQGNILWDCIAFLDAATIAQVKALGGLKAIAISHPHFYTTMIEWSRAFDDAPIYLHRANQPWVMRPDPAVHFWDGETRELLPDVTLVRCGGHFPGSTVLHWSAADHGAGALFTGDTLQVASDQRYVSFMYSYPNMIPLDEQTVRRIVAAVEPLAFTQLYGGWRQVVGDAKTAVQRSAERYIAHLRGEVSR